MSSSIRLFYVVPILLGFLLPAAAAAAAPENTFPTRPIRWVVPFAPGGSADVVARYLGAKLGDRLGQQVVIDNRSGAGGIIGVEMVANSPADGYTLLMVTTSFVMNAAVRPLPYDVEKSFDPIAMFGSSPNAIVVNPRSGVNSLRELVDRAKKEPVNYASSGVGSFNHFGGELFNKVAGIKMVHIPYKGGGPAMIDVMAGQVPVMFTSVTQVLPNVRAGRIKMLAIGSTKRSPVVPDIPTVAEAGFPGYDVVVWWGVSGPAGMPRAVQEKLHRGYTAVLKEPETEKVLASDSAEIHLMTALEFRKLIQAEVKKWSSIAKEAGIKNQ